MDRKEKKMSDRPTITHELSLAVKMYLNPNNDPRIYCAKEVTFDYQTANRKRVDFMKFQPLNNSVSGIEKGDFYCYEIKSSVEDFLSPNGHNFLGDFNYYVMPEEVYEKVKEKIPYYVGVLVPDHMNMRGPWYDLRSVKRAHRQNRERSLAEMLLMMFRSAARDSLKKKKKEKGDAV